MTTEPPPLQRGIVRLYDHYLRLLSTAHAPANAPTVNLNQGFMFSHGAVVTFTPTTSEDQAAALLSELQPMFSPRVHWLSQPGGQDYMEATGRAERHDGHYAWGAYVEPCPTCSAPAHSPCRSDGRPMPEAHSARGKAAAACTAARRAAFHADPGYVVWTSREPLRPELRRTVPAR